MTRLAVLMAVYFGRCFVGGAAFTESAMHRQARRPITATDRAAAADLGRSRGAQ